MTIQGALTDLKNLLNADDIPYYHKPSIKKIIETIEQEPQTGKEYYSKEDVLKAVNSLTEIHDSGMVEMITTLNNIDFIKMKINELPPVTLQQKTGYWITTYGNVRCSVCGNTKDGRSVGKATHYCDFCGARMEGTI